MKSRGISYFPHVSALAMSSISSSLILRRLMRSGLQQDIAQYHRQGAG